MFFLARVKFKYWGTLLGIVLLLLTGGYFIVKKAYIEPGRKIEAQLLKRVVTWVNRVDNTVEEWKSPADQKYSLEDDYQRTIAKVAIAHGGASPFGVLPGNSTERNFLPQAFADYIFAIIVEESGIVGALFLMFIYLAILFRSCLISSKYAEYSAMLMVMGLALMLTCQALVSMMVSVGIGPVTGQPLPMISRGGTSALVTSLYFGILMCVSLYLRCIPTPGDYNFYVFCYDKDMVMNKLAKDKGLPLYSYAYLPTTQEEIRIDIAQSGYTPIRKQGNGRAANEMNRELGISPAQAEAMKVGSMFGWNVPGADPKNYDENGKAIRKKDSREER